MMSAKYLPAQKFCSGCGLTKPRPEWSLNRTTPSGLATNCKACSAEYKREYRARLSRKRLAKLMQTKAAVASEAEAK